MTTLTKDIVIPPDRKIVVELPADVPAGQATITITVEMTMPTEVHDGKNGIASLRGLGKGKVWMADDFNAPLEDFAEYM
ncbi:MAG: DUF2281 domain-containing protein [Planctomycetes bacterium]|nr:DUF2281 domain-containing protein [Planctomycetota bacterium]MCD7897615.1 DUF2281 domain-containing protein [Planctomycetaceae bacterium]